MKERQEVLNTPRGNPARIHSSDWIQLAHNRKELLLFKEHANLLNVQSALNDISG
jgi:hypothetical protein